MQPIRSANQSVSKAPINWTFVIFLSMTHLAAALAVWYMMVVRFDLKTIVLAVAMYVLMGLAITAGYHRLFSHRSYQCHRYVQAFYLFFGAGAFQESALKWCWDHRDHHSNTDDLVKDPYCFPLGFWRAHITWMLRKRDTSWRRDKEVRDLARNRLVAWQNRWYLPQAVVAGLILPVSIASLWGDPLGGLLVAGSLRIVCLHHTTWSVNSFAHWIGDQPFPTNISPKNSWWVALLTFGEGYHANHHRFSRDYRNAFKWYQYDPSKWLIGGLEHIGLASNLRRTSPARIEQAKTQVLAR